MDKNEFQLNTKCVALIGRAGSGKSTVGRILAVLLEYTYLSIGDIARSMQDEQLKCGGLADENAMRETFRSAVVDHITNGQVNFIIDGMPRTKDQIDFLLQIFDQVHVVELSTDRKLADKRLSDRKRSDDNIQTINKRQNIYDSEIQSIKNKLIKYSMHDKIKSYKMYKNNDNTNIDKLIKEIIEEGNII